MEEKQRIVQVWDQAAPSFGRVGPRYWDRFGSRLVELSSIQEGSKVLDIGMGRGASLFPATGKVGKQGQVEGIDASEVMVSETYKDILEQGLHNVSVKRMDAGKLEFQDGSFDNVLCGFSIGCLLYSDSGLDGMLRVLKDGGQAGFSVWGVQQDQKWLGEIVSKYLKNNAADGNATVLKFDTTESMRRILKDSGFTNINVYEEQNDVAYEDKEEWWQEMWSNAVRGIFQRIQELGADKFQQFKQDVFNALESFEHGGKLHFNMPVIYAYGEKI